jgi:hypothetical protein
LKASKDKILVGDKRGNGKEWFKARLHLAQARLRQGLKGDKKLIADAINDF